MTEIKIIYQSIYYNVYTKKKKKLIRARLAPLGSVVVVPPLALPNLLCILLIEPRYCIILISIQKKMKEIILKSHLLVGPKQRQMRRLGLFLLSLLNPSFT